MPLRFLLDENVRGPLWRAASRHNAKGSLPLDVVQVGDPDDLPLGTPDESILVWCEREDRLLVSFDRDTLPAHLAAHLAQGRRLPGILLLRPESTIADVVESLVLIAHAGDSYEFRDRTAFIP